MTKTEIATAARRFHALTATDTDFAVNATRQAIRDAAEAAGWVRVNSTDHSYDEFKRPTGRRYVFVSFSVRDTVVSASTPKSYIHGANKAARIIAILAAA